MNNKTINNDFVEKLELHYKPTYFFDAIKQAIKMNNYGRDNKTLSHVARVVDFTNLNSKEFTDYDMNLKLLKKVQHFSIEDFAKKIFESDEFIQLIQDEGTFIVKQVDNDSGSNNRIINQLISFDESFKKRVINLNRCEVINETIENSEIKRVIYIDDFVGKGTTVRNFTNSEKSEKVLICKYIVESTYQELLSEGYKILKDDFAYQVDDNTLKYYTKRNPRIITVNKDYHSKTLISENYNSPNNNFPYIYYSEKNKWTNFLNTRSKHHSNAINLNKIRSKTINDLYVNIIENEGQNFLRSMGIDSRERIREKFIEAIGKATYSSSEDKFIIDKDDLVGDFIMTHINNFFAKFKESIPIRPNKS